MRDITWPVDPRTLDDAARDLLDRNTHLVGWGTGSVFDYFHRLHPVRLDALVDSDQARWGRQRGGVEVRDPATLADRDPATTFVIIYSSFWPEIQTQLAALGPYRSLPASAVFAEAGARARLATAAQLAAQVGPRHPTDPADAVVVQGPIVPAVTERVVRATAALYPENLIVLSTWSDADGDAVASVKPFVDEIVTTPLPVPTGIQNRNCQLVSTRRGMARAIELGARTVLKTRSDIALIEPDLFRRARWWLGRLPSGPSRAAGLRGRLIVPSSFTRKYLLYHPSDLTMLGDAEDMMRYWGAVLDTRTGSLLSPPWLDQSLAAVNLAGNPSESYLGVELCRSIGRPVVGTLEDSWAFYRDLFAVVDDEWFGLLWFKNLAIPDAALCQGVRQTVTRAFWERLQTGRALAELDAGDIDPAAVSLAALSGAAA